MNANLVEGLALQFFMNKSEYFRKIMFLRLKRILRSLELMVIRGMKKKFSFDFPVACSSLVIFYEHLRTKEGFHCKGNSWCPGFFLEIR